MTDKIDQSPHPGIRGCCDRAAMAPPVVGLNGEDQQMMAYSPSGQSDRFAAYSPINANRLNLGSVMAACWRAVDRPSLRTAVMFHPVPERMPPGQLVS